MASTELLIAVSLAVFIVPAVFLATVAFAASRRRNAREIGPRVAATLSFTGAASLGTMLQVRELLGDRAKGKSGARCGRG